MVRVKLKNLVKCLDDAMRQSLEVAAGDAMALGHHNVEISHWLRALLKNDELWMRVIIEGQSLDRQKLQDDLEVALAKLPTGNDRPPGLSPDLVVSVQDAWVLASVDFGVALLSSPHLMLTLRQAEDLASSSRLPSGELEKLSVEALAETASQVKGGKLKDRNTGEAESTPTVALDKFTVDLTKDARDGKIDPVIGRNQEVRKVVDILCRRRQNNPLLVGEPGVGKTAIVEGFALRIVAGEVPERLKDVSLRTLDLALLQAGASIKGEFENRLKDVLKEVKQSATPVIIFIDEAHTLIGAGGASGQHDAANLLKPALARGEFRTVAATTWAEYKKYMEKDQALARRFQLVTVPEPEEADCRQILLGLLPSMEKHHGVRVLDSAVNAAVKLSVRYLPSRRLPDKAISLLDTACSRVNLSLFARPERIESLEQELRYLTSELATLNREQVLMGQDSTETSVSDLEQKISQHNQSLEQARENWQKERSLVEELQALQRGIEKEAGDDKDDSGESVENLLQEVPEKSELQKTFRSKLEALKDLQGEHGLVTPMVDDSVIAAIVSSWTGIPLGSLMSDELNKLLTLEDRMYKRIIGQSFAIATLGKSLRVSRAGLTDARKPVGVYLMCGPSGVGKTEMGLVLADLLYAGERDLVTINMSEFKEEHKVSMLLGAPAGYVGYGEGGVLTEAVRRNPWCIVVLDEMEKAHPGIQDIFFQIFDRGHVKDSEGVDVDFRNTLIMMTSNAAAQTICDMCGEDEEKWPRSTEVVEAIKPELEKYFRPAFLGRTQIVPFYPLRKTELTGIARIALGRVEKRIRDNYQAAFKYDDSVLDYLVIRSQDPHIGARAIEHLINRVLLPDLAVECITRLNSGAAVTAVTVRCTDSKLQFDIQ